MNEDHIFTLYRHAVMHKEQPSFKEARDKFVDAIKNDSAALESLADYYFSAKSKTHWQSKQGKSLVMEKVATKTKRTAAQRAADQLKKIASLKADIKHVILMDTEMPTGKKLRESTGSECRKAGGFYAAIGEYLKPNQLVDRALSEAELQNIKARFYQTNSENA